MTKIEELENNIKQMEEYAFELMVRDKKDSSSEKLIVWRMRVYKMLADEQDKIRTAAIASQAV